MKIINIILATTPKGEIGINNTIPWKLKGDLKRFKELTMGHVVIMGRKTYESLPKPLEGRKMIIVSTTMLHELHPDANKQKVNAIYNNDNYIVDSLEKAISCADYNFKDKKIFIIGGVKSYQKYVTDMAAAAPLALGELSLPVMKKSKDVTQTEVEIPLIGKDTMSVSFTGTKEVRNPSADGEMMTKFGTVNVSIDSYAAGNRGELKKVKSILAEQAAAVLSK